MESATTTTASLSSSKQQQQQQQDYQGVVILQSESDQVPVNNQVSTTNSKDFAETSKVIEKDDTSTSKENFNNENEYLELVRELKLQLSEKSDECELLKLKLSESNQDVEMLNLELNECRLAIFENNEDSRKTHEEMMKSKKLEENCVKLMSDLFDLKEQSDNFKQNLMDKYIAKTNTINNLECLLSSGTLTNDLNNCKEELDEKLNELQLALAKVRNLEDEISLKDKNLTDLRKALEDAKIAHLHEIKVLEEYIECLKNTVSSYEKTLANYELKSQLEETSLLLDETS